MKYYKLWYNVLNERFKFDHVFIAIKAVYNSKGIEILVVIIREPF